MDPSISVFQATTLALALLGAVLGVINTWQSLDRTRVKLRVAPAHAIPFGAMDSRLRFAIEVTNFSAFAVTVGEVGVLYHGTPRRGVIPAPVLLDNGPWPRRLEPRESISIYSPRPEPHPAGKIRYAYAKTQCGVTKTGTSPALEQIANGTEL